ncbi:uncharacterized protein LTR77_000720 [Saxophila tyrrhenica]|uniref:N-acetyltransferase domain-containing protein n=1 Tax=Saxophila tyrrhenica TaxID=1690608 RepID=A0AAV9PPC1_9PEZI|nr:hypothetical protein LTR77_000720 [Saxophila tyrrhenica]
MCADASSFVLSRAKVEDIPEVVELQYDAFPDFARRAFMGCYSRDDIAKVAAYYMEEMRTDPSDIWIKVNDVESGKIVAASNWKLYSTSALPHGTDKVPTWIEDEEAKELTRTILEPMNELRLKENVGPFIRNAAEYRRRGVASMMMQWGCDLADLLSLPGWIEASPEGDQPHQNPAV